MSARFLIAKYAPDVRRMEPRNVGVIVWLNGRTDSKFVGESSDGPVSAPKRFGIRDQDTYRQWIGSWRTQLTKHALEGDRGKIVPRESPEFVDVLRDWSRGNYMLVDGGKVPEPIKDTEIGALTKYLFRELVADREVSSAEHEYERLKAASLSLLRSTGVADRADFRREQPAFFNVYNLSRQFTFDYAVGPSEKPYSLYHRVILSHAKTFDSVVFNLQWFAASRKYGRDRIAALVYEPSPTTVQKSENHLLLENMATVINVADEDKARHQLIGVASKNGKP